MFEERNGKRYRRASWPETSAAFAYSGVPKAGAPVLMFTLVVKAP